MSEQGTQVEKTAWVQSAVNGLLANGTTAVVTFNAGDYDVEITSGTESDDATIVVTEESLTDAQKVAADVALVEAGTYEIPLTEQGTQAEKTAWVQSAVNGLLANGTTAVVTFNAGDYDVEITLGTESDDAIINVTEEL